MVFMKRLLLLLLPLLASCSHKEIGSGDVGYYSIFTYAAKVQKEKGWLIHHYGGGFHEKIDEIYMSFSIRQHVTIDEARRLMVTTIGDFLTHVNQDERVKPFLNPYPYTSDSLDIGLAFVDDEYIMLYNHELAFVLLKKGKIVYCIRGDGMLEDIHEETLEEAYRIVEQEKLKVEKTDL